MAAEAGRSKSSVVREAITQYGVAHGAPGAAKQSAFDRLRPFIGVIATGGADYSRDTHARYRALLERKRRARRPR
jgi:hypothetical protein